MIVVSDTSPVANLIVIQRLALLRDVFNEVLIPEKVHEEIMALKNFSVSLQEYEHAGWIQVAKPEDFNLINQLRQNLDAGEAEAIALAKTIHADVLLIDELKGRKVAGQKTLRYIGLLGVLLLAKQKSLVSEVKPILDELINKAGFRVADDLYKKVLAKANE